jgi:predicted adenylyl cyclase CyaB
MKKLSSSNIEIKARVEDLNLLQSLVENLSDTQLEILQQEDIFFNVKNGRLKLRIFSADNGELIYYERSNSAGPEKSVYIISHTDEPASLRDALTAALGIKIIVRKRRSLYKVGQMRIHLDEVEELGKFMELEYVLRPGQDPSEGEAATQDMMIRLGISRDLLVSVAYADLLEESR